MPIRRPRAVIASLSVLAAAVLALAGCSIVDLVGSSLRDGGRVDTVGTVTFETPLAIPPLASSTMEGDTRVFDLVAQSGTTRFGDRAVPTAGYNGSYLGPTLVADRGERVRVDFHNELAETTTLHWHGMHLPAAMDGGPHQPVAPGDDWHPEWSIDQPAATLWYHPHPHGQTEGQVARGLAGLVILRDELEAALPLPRQYGVDDVPVIVADTGFDAEGDVDRGNAGFVGSLGDTLLVNGTVGPYLDVTTEAVRLRLLNASTARSYNFGLGDDRSFALIASDGGLLARPFSTDRIQLSPGERAEIVVRLVPGETVVLRSTEPDLGGDAGERNGGADRFDVLQLRAASTLLLSPELPADLAAIEPLEPGGIEREIRLDGFTINGAAMDLDRIDEVVEVGDTEVWTVRNGMDLPHNFHVHDVQFQVLTIAGEPPPPELAGWKDTIYLRPQTDYRLALQFTDYTDASTPYMYHCHLLWHEDKGMMGQFVVVAPGQSAGTIEGDNHDHH